MIFNVLKQISVISLKLWYKNLIEIHMYKRDFFLIKNLQEIKNTMKMAKYGHLAKQG